MAANPEKTALVPSITGSPQVDTFLGYLAVKVGIIAAAASIAWMDAHGFDTKALAKDGVDLSTLISTAVMGSVLALAAMIWGVWRTRKSQLAIVNNTIHAALTGEVPVAVVAKASEAQARAVEDSPRTTIVSTPPPPSS